MKNQTLYLDQILNRLPATIKWVDENNPDNWVIYSFQMSKGLIGYRFEGEDDHYGQSFIIQDGDFTEAARKLLDWCEEEGYV